MITEVPTKRCTCSHPTLWNNWLLETAMFKKWGKRTSMNDSNCKIQPLKKSLKKYSLKMWALRNSLTNIRVFTASIAAQPTEWSIIRICGNQRHRKLQLFTIINSISIGSAVFAQLTGVHNKAQTHRPRYARHAKQEAASTHSVYALTICND